jgi:serine/threonine protein kinase
MPTRTEKNARTSVARYQLLEQIGGGGMGTVYRGRDPQTDTVVAVKVFAADLVADPVLLERFTREFNAAAKLEHPNVVRPLDFGTDGNVSYLVTEFVEGTTLGQMIDDQGRLTEEAAVRIITQVAQALQYAHERNVIHRDVKPDNILVRVDGMVKLADFGLAKDYDNDQALTRPASGLGTPHFMAPEQYQDAKHVDARSDVYSLGATLYSAVTGRVPFDGCASLVALARKVKGDMPSARELVPGLSPRVDAAIRKAMNPDKLMRPASCLEFFKLLAGRRPVVSRPRGPRTRSSAGGAKLPTDRRVYVRHAVGLGASAAIDTAVCGGSRELWPLVLQDASAAGVGVLLARRFESGTLLSIEVGQGPGAPGRSLPVRVVRVTSEPLGHWLHGCTFLTPLTEPELAALVAETMRPRG